MVLENKKQTTGKIIRDEKLLIRKGKLNPSIVKAFKFGFEQAKLQFQEQIKGLIADMKIKIVGGFVVFVKIN